MQSWNGQFRILKTYYYRICRIRTIMFFVAKCCTVLVLLSTDQLLGIGLKSTSFETLKNQVLLEHLHL